MVLGAQLHVGPTPPTPDHPRLRPSRRTLAHAIFCKPDDGLWTSSWRGPRAGSDWVQWCLLEGVGVPDGGRWRAHRLRVAPTARVYTIDRLDDLVALVERYPSANPWGLGQQWPSWTDVAQDFDGVHLTRAGQARTRFSFPTSLYGWDVESTVWFRWAFAGVIDLGERAFALPADRGEHHAASPTR